jgi:hypothetical protein
MFIKKLIQIAIILVVINYSSIAIAQTGIIKGVVKESSTGETLPGANVIIEGTTIGSSTDFDGEFIIKGLNPGVYNIKATFISFNEKIIANVEVKSGSETTINIELEDAALTISSVTIEGRKRRDRENVLLLEQRNATLISQNIGAQELSRKGIGNVASALTKISGVSKQEGNSNIYVRGLGDRYNSTTLNGLPIPSNNPEEKNISLALFTTDIVSHISIDKVFNNSIYGDFAGGNVNIVSKRHTEDDFLSLEVGSGANQNAIEENRFLLQQGPNYFGFNTTSAPKSLAHFDFENSMTPKSANPANLNFLVSAGSEFNLFGRTLSVFGTAGFSNDFSSKEGIALNVNSAGSPTKDLRFKSFDYSSNSTAMINADYRLNVKNSIQYNLLFINSSDQLYEDYRGTIIDIANEDNGRLDRKTYERHTLLVNQLNGEHSLSNRSTITWGTSYNLTSSDTPDRIQNTFRIVEGEYYFGQNQITDNHRYFHYLSENELAANFAFDYKFGKASEENYKGKLTFGSFARFKQRDFNASQFNFRIKINGIVNPENLDEYFNQSNLENDYFTIETFRGNKFVPNALNPQVYSAIQLIPGLYGSIEYKLNPKFTALFGLRVESVFQEISWNTQLDPRDRNDAIEKIEILPNLTAKYQLTDKQNLRFAASKTYTLPQFKERAMFIYEDVTQVKIGNTDLYASENYNIDFKWEFFPRSSELIAISTYGKYILNPINEVTISSATNDISFINTGNWGYVAGVEVEARKEIATKGKSKLYAGFNASFLHTEQELNSEKVKEETRYRVAFTNDRSRFSGASDWLANADLTYSYSFYGQRNSIMATLAYNYSSDNVYAIGTNTRGNIIDQEFHALDFILRIDINNKISFGATLKNILNPKVERVQENANQDIIVLSYRKGMVGGLKLGVKF